MEQEIEEKKIIKTQFNVSNYTIPLQFEDNKYSQLINARSKQLKQKIYTTENEAILQRLQEIHNKYGTEVTNKYVERKNFLLYSPYLFMVKIYGMEYNYYDALQKLEQLKNVQNQLKEKIPEDLKELEKRIRNILTRSNTDFRNFCKLADIPFQDTAPEIGYGYVEQQSIDNFKTQIEKHQIYINDLKEKFNEIQEQAKNNNSQIQSNELISKENEIKRQQSLQKLLESILERWIVGFRCGKHYNAIISENKINFSELI